MSPVRLSTAPLCVMALCLGLSSPVFAQAAPAGRITVTGEASVSAVPDMATISVGVTTVANTADAALSANSADVAKVIQRLEAMKVPQNQFQTSGLSLRPNYAPGTANRAPQITGFTASNTLTITLNKIDRVGAVLDGVVHSGANRLEGLTFGLSDPGPLETKARKLAVADARSRALTLAAAAGLKLGPVVSISESGRAQPPVLAMRASAAMPVPIAPGTTSVSDSVTVVWRMEQ